MRQLWPERQTLKELVHQKQMGPPPELRRELQPQDFQRELDQGRELRTNPLLREPQGLRRIIPQLGLEPLRIIPLPPA